MILAGTPPTMALSGTSFVTVLPAPTMAFRPIVTLQYSRVGAYPYMIFQNDRFRMCFISQTGWKQMIECGEYHCMTYLAIVSYRYATVVLKVAAGVDKYVFPYCDVFAEVGIKRRKETECLIDGLAYDL